MLREIIDYLYREEKKHYEESGKPNGHIFETIRRTKKLLNKKYLTVKQLRTLFGKENLDFGRYCLFFNRTRNKGERQ